MSKLHLKPSGCCAHDEDRSHEHNHAHSHSNDEGFNLREELTPLVLITALYVPGLILEDRLHSTPYSFIEYLLFIPAYLISGWSVLSSAGRNILRGRIFDENFLMTVATLGAIAIHELPEAVGVILFLKVGELFQEFSVSRSRRSIKSLADVGMAMGGLGSDAAIETADAVIMTDAPSKMAEASAMGKKTQRIVWQNISRAIAVKGVFIVLGIFGLATMWEAVIVDVGVALLAIFNSSRVLRAS